MHLYNCVCTVFFDSQMLRHRDIFLLNSILSIVLYGLYSTPSETLENLSWFVPYVGLVMMAMTVIFLGSRESEAHRQNDEGKNYETITTSSAIYLPLHACLLLFTFSAAMHITSKQVFNFVFVCYLTLVGIFSVNSLFLHLSGRKPSVFSGLLSIAIALLHALSPLWVTNNILGISFCFQAISQSHISRTTTGLILLSGLFCYDILWVFGSDLMLSLAHNIDAPIKLVVPHIFHSGDFHYSLLGLGDIIVPGIFVALMHRFDMAMSRKGISCRFFLYSMAGYTIGLLCALAAVIVYSTAQPALLYIVPAIFLSTGGCALASGNLMYWFLFDEDTLESVRNLKIDSDDYATLPSERSILFRDLALFINGSMRDLFGI